MSDNINKEESLMPPLLDIKKECKPFSDHNFMFTKLTSLITRL
jgi:hypothetical protein